MVLLTPASPKTLDSAEVKTNGGLSEEVRSELSSSEQPGSSSFLGAIIGGGVKEAASVASHHTTKKGRSVSCMPTRSPSEHAGWTMGYRDKPGPCAMWER
jgi:hypothetical protein